MDINIKRENTAIRRNKLSVPFKFLLKNNLLNGTVLDYGCGRGDNFEELSKPDKDPLINYRYNKNDKKMMIEISDDEREKSRNGIVGRFIICPIDINIKTIASIVKAINLIFSFLLLLSCFISLNSPRLLKPAFFINSSILA